MYSTGRKAAATLRVHSTEQLQIIAKNHLILNGIVKGEKH